MLSPQLAFGDTTAIGLWMASGTNLDEEGTKAFLDISQGCGELPPGELDLSRLKPGQPTHMTFKEIGQASHRAGQHLSAEGWGAFANLITGKPANLSQMPLRARQAIRNLAELEGYRRLLLRIPGNTGVSAPIRSCLERLDATEQILYDMVRHCSADESLLETVYKVLHRGRPLPLLKRGEPARIATEEHMKGVIAAAQDLFPGDWQVFSENGKRNFISGEATGNALEGKYRFARMLLNARSGKPLQDVPADDEKNGLRYFVERRLGYPAPSYLSALMVFRDATEAFSKSWRDAFRSCDPSMRCDLVEQFFGPFRHRLMADLATAQDLIEFVGDVGIHRELAMSVYPDNGSLLAVVSLGDLDGVSSEDEATTIVHTHPYVSEIAPLIDMEEISFEEPVLFSSKDVSMSLADAIRVFQMAGSGTLPPSVLYDANQRTYKNWVRSPYGASRMEIRLTGFGQPVSLDIYFSPSPDYENDPVVLQSLNTDKLMGHEYSFWKKYGISVRFIRAPYHEVSRGDWASLA